MAKKQTDLRPRLPYDLTTSPKPIGATSLLTNGRMFYQCDFDIVGEHDPMLPDAEILKMTSEIFEALGWQGKYTIKINHRKIPDGIFEVHGAPTEKLRTISSAVNRLDKVSHAQNLLKSHIRTLR